ncbi:MAG: twin-arginine translocase subunit TatC [Coriobacteriales bacterium]|jgi:sec-independent protein translocase protein TatC|nr:twin-arginine translocase subunit TatC [Coriobacteriales bacterium]
MLKSGQKVSILTHLNELRHRVFVIVIALLIATVVLYFFAPYLILFLIKPVAQFIAPNMPINTTADLTHVLNVLNPLGGFSLQFKVSLLFGVVATSPIWIWQLMAFFLPALKPREKRWVVPTFFVAVVLFVLGMVFCYLVILRPAFQWMLGQTVLFANIMANAPDYVNLIMLFEVAFGIAFELPLVVFYLIVFGIVPYKKLRHSWRIVYVALLVLSAVVTPDASPVTMFLMFFAMVALYEASLAAARLVLSRRIKNLAARAEAEAAVDAECAK